MAGLSDELLELRERVARLESAVAEIDEGNAVSERRLDALALESAASEYPTDPNLRCGICGGPTDHYDAIRLLHPCPKCRAKRSAASEPERVEANVVGDGAVDALRYIAEQYDEPLRKYTEQVPATRADVAASEQRVLARLDALALPAAPSSFVREVERIRDEMIGDRDGDTCSRPWRECAWFYADDLTTALDALGREGCDE